MPTSPPPLRDVAAAGIYALTSFTVTRSRRGIGVRAALGADPRRILAGVFSRAAAQLGIGTVIAAAAAFMLEGLTGASLPSGTGWPSSPSSHWYWS